LSDHLKEWDELIKYTMPPVRADRSKRWCFTLNNYTPEEVESVNRYLSSGEIAYAVYGKEIGDTGTPHLQGYLRLVERKRFATVKNAISGRCHLECAIRSEGEAADYCKKGSDIGDNGDPVVDFIEFNKENYDPDLGASKGQRCDLRSIYTRIENGERNVAKLRKEFPLVLARYPRFVQDVLRDTRPPRPPREDHPLKQWQQTLMDQLSEDPDDRKILFIVDEVGNAGKSWFCTHYMYTHPGTAILLRPCKKDDMAKMLPDSNDELRVVFMDVEKSSAEFLQYSFLESLKDGVVSSPKYDSCIKEFSRLHVVVFMNVHPDMDKLSGDRYVIMVV
jgi:Putative viral replication protein